MLRTTSANMKPLTRTILLFALILLPAMVHSHPGKRRLLSEKTIGTHDVLFDSAATEEKEMGMQVNEEQLQSIKHRQKRLSDQRRAELETLMALSKMTGKLVTVSRGGRQLDTAKIGRRRRSIVDMSLKNLGKLFRLSAVLGQKGNAAYPVIS